MNVSDELDIVLLSKEGLYPQYNHSFVRLEFYTYPSHVWP